MKQTFHSSEKTEMRDATAEEFNLLVKLKNPQALKEKLKSDLAGLSSIEDKLNRIIEYLSQ